MSGNNDDDTRRVRGAGAGRWAGVGFLVGGILGFLVTLAYIYFR